VKRKTQFCHAGAKQASLRENSQGRTRALYGKISRDSGLKSIAGALPLCYNSKINVNTRSEQDLINLTAEIAKGLASLIK